MRNWLEPQEITPSQALQDAVGGQLLVAQTLARRGLVTPEQARPFLDPALYQPARPGELPGLEQAADRLESAVQFKQRICVWGDFDVDGQTSTTLLVSVLKELGADVFHHIPVRDTESHGVNLTQLQRVIKEGANLVLTCDTGINAHEAVNYAQSFDVDMVISDHHDLPASLPQACAVTNPKFLPVSHPLYNLPGVGVAYKLAEELCQRRGCGEAVEQNLDLAALGIVADLALQTGDTRYLLQRGLAQLRKTHRKGLLALLELADTHPARLTEEHIGFILAPRLNALGRLSDANSAVDFFTTSDLDQARLLASQLEALNARRKLMTDQVFQGALKQIERDPSLADQAAIVLSNPAWPAGVIGIVASRLVERFYRPVVLLSAPARGPARGSARSVEGCNITAAIATQAKLLLNYGGHPMAAGLAMEAANLPEFRRGFVRAVEQMLVERDVQPALSIDAYVPFSGISLELANQIEQLAPFGPGNPALTLASTGLSLKSCTPVGRSEEHLQLILEHESGYTEKAIWWQGAGWPLPEGRFDLAYHLRATSYQGIRQVQVEWVDFRPSSQEVIELETHPALSIVDYRDHPQPVSQLKEVLAQGGCQVWREAGAAQRLDALGVPGVGRAALKPGPNLVIWTTPPGPAELKAALEAAAPTTVYLFAVDPETASPEAFLKRLAGLVKHLLTPGSTSTSTSLVELAAATAQTQAAVVKGLAWLEARRYLSVLLKDETASLGQVGLGPPASSAAQGSPNLDSQVKALLDETAAYRAYFRRADPGRLFEDLRHG